MSDLTESVEQRFRAAWPGSRTTGDGRFHTYPRIRDGGSTHAALTLLLEILAEEETKKDVAELRRRALSFRAAWQEWGDVNDANAAQDLEERANALEACVNASEGGDR